MPENAIEDMSYNLNYSITQLPRIICEVMNSASKEQEIKTTGGLPGCAMSHDSRQSKRLDASDLHQAGKDDNNC